VYLAAEQLADLLGLRVGVYVEPAPLRGGSDFVRRTDAPFPVALAVPAGSGSAWPALDETSPAPQPVVQAVRSGSVVPDASADEPALAVPLPGVGALLLEGAGATTLSRAVHMVVTEIAATLADAVTVERRARSHDRDGAVVAALHRLLEVGMTAGSALEAAQALARTMAEALEVSTACTCIVDERGLITDVLTFGAAPERAAEARRQLVGTPIADSPVGRQVMSGRSGEPVLVADTGPSGAVRKGGLAQSLGLRCVAAVPILSGEGPVGVASIGDTSGPRVWQNRDRELLQQLARQGTLVVDNARLREAERRQARSDELTGLANRRTFHEQLDHGVIRNREDGRPLAVLHIDLDRFKEVNDRYGHHQGDALLVAVTRRLTAQVRGDDVIARLGGDEFGVILSGYGDPAAPVNTARRLLAALREPIALDGASVGIGASIGVAGHAEGEESGAALLRRADQAMYAAKRAGGGYVVAPVATLIEPHLQIDRGVPADPDPPIQPDVPLQSDRFEQTG
jgi:diguanylate cyclase (GGDEF)-like protein